MYCVGVSPVNTEISFKVYGSRGQGWKEQGINWTWVTCGSQMLLGYKLYQPQQAWSIVTAAGVVAQPFLVGQRFLIPMRDRETKAQSGEEMSKQGEG